MNNGMFLSHFKIGLNLLVENLIEFVVSVLASIAL